MPTDIGQKQKANKEDLVDHIETEEINEAKTHADPKLSELKRKNSEDSEDFDRANESEDILESHINRNDREKIKNLIQQVKEDETEVINKVEYEDYEDSDLARESIEEDEDEQSAFLKVTPVTKEQILPQAKKILQVWKDNDIEILDVQDLIFQDYSITSKVSVINLAKLLINQFDFDQEEAILLSRYMIETPDDFKNGDKDGPVTYKFNPDKQLSHAKVISKLQSVMTGLQMEE